MLKLEYPQGLEGKCTNSGKFDCSLSGAEGNERGETHVKFDYRENGEDIQI